VEDKEANGVPVLMKEAQHMDLIPWQLREGAVDLKLYDVHGNEKSELPVCTPETVGLEIAAQQRKVSKSGRDLQGVDLCGLNFRGLNFRGCNFEGANLVGTKLDGCDLRETNMRRAILSTGFLPPTPGDKCWEEWGRGTNGQKATEVASMQRVLLAGAKLSETVLQGVDMTGSDGQKTHELEAVCLNHAHLQGVILRRAHLENADLTYAHLENAVLV